MSKQVEMEAAINMSNV